MPISKSSKAVKMYSTEYDFKMQSKQYSLQDIDSINFCIIDNKPDDKGLIACAVTVYMKNDFDNRVKTKPSDIFNLYITGKVKGKSMGTMKTIQGVKYCQSKVLVDDKMVDSKIPEEFEEGKMYTFIGYMIHEEEEIEVEKPIAKSTKFRM